MIRKAKQEDLVRCGEIISDSLMWERYERTLEDAVSFVTREFHAGTHIWVYEENSAVIGFIGCIEKGMMGEFPYIRFVAVAREHRNKGIGKKLITFLEEKMFPLKPLIFLLVPYYSDAQRLYYRLGYQKVGEIPNYKKEGINEYLLMKRRPY